MNSLTTVLVVDDDFYVAGFHRDIAASRSGFEVLEPVHTARAAREAMRAHKPDLLLIDVYLPDGDGIDLLREFDIDAFVISAASDGAKIRRALRAGALGYLVKPFDAPELTDRLDAYQRFRNVLPEDRPADQEAIERALRILHSGDVAVPTASRSATEQLVLAQLGDAEVSAIDVAGKIGVSRATAQRYLSTLAARGLVEITLNYGTTGRPEHRYLKSGSP